MMLSLPFSEVGAAPLSETEAASSSRKIDKAAKPQKESTPPTTPPNSNIDSDRRTTVENETIWLEEKLSPTTQWLERAVNPLRRWMEDKVQRPAKQEAKSNSKNLVNVATDIERSQSPKNTADVTDSQISPLINSEQAGLIASSQIPGDVLKIKLLRNAPMRYRVKLISLRGQIHYVYINASNAQIIKQPQASPSSPKTKASSP